VREVKWVSFIAKGGKKSLGLGAWWHTDGGQEEEEDEAQREREREREREMS